MLFLFLESVLCQQQADFSLFFSPLQVILPLFLILEPMLCFEGEHFEEMSSNQLSLV